MNDNGFKVFKFPPRINDNDELREYELSSSDCNFLLLIKNCYIFCENDQIDNNLTATSFYLLFYCEAVSRCNVVLQKLHTSLFEMIYQEVV